MTPETTWTLYVDESGDFSDPDDCIAVAGLLLRGDAETSLAELRGDLERALPWCTWPLHASHINHPAYLALCWHVRFGTTPAAGDDDFARAARSAVGWLNSVQRPIVEQLLSEIRERRRPDVSMLKTLGRLLKEGRSQNFRQLEGGVREAWARLKRSARQLAATGGAAFLVAASETEMGDAGGETDERYFALLEALLERTAALLARREGRHRVGVRVLARNVQNLRTGWSNRLSTRHLKETIGRFVSDEGGPVRLVPEEVANFDEHAGLPFVLADFTANLARRTLRPESTDLRSAESELVDGFGVAARSGNPGRSHLAATGESLRYIRTCCRRGASPPVEPLRWKPHRRAWAVQQALEWAPHG